MMSERITVGELVARFLEACDVTTVFGVISIHNMPILDAFGQRGKIRFISSRGEAGGTAMADAYARVTGSLGVVCTSTGNAAGNAAGALVEAQTAGTPLLHLTGQIELPYLDRNMAYIHEAVDQPGMLKAISKSFHRVWSPETALGVLREAVQIALTPPMGPVSVEIPIDVQEALVDVPSDLAPLPLVLPVPSEEALDALAEKLAVAKRPMIWLGGGTRAASHAASELADMGFGIVTSVQGRGALKEGDPRSLGAFNLSPPVEDFYQTCDAMLVVGSRLRSNETLKYKLKLPRPLYQVDIDPSQSSRSYPNEHFVCGDAKAVLEGLVARLKGRMAIDPSFAGDLTAAKDKAVDGLEDALGPYADLVKALQEVLPEDFVWVRDVTVSNSTWGNRHLKISNSRNGVHAMGGGIGLGMVMGIGAALGAGGRKTVALSGDGGLMLNLGEMACAAQEQADLLLLVMNDKSYGVIRNIQDARFDGRQYYVDLHTPKFEDLCRSMGWSYRKLDDMAKAPELLKEAVADSGPRMVEVDMHAIGPFKRPFAGPPVKKPA